MLRSFTKGGKCGCIVLIKNDVLGYNPPYMQFNFTCNLGPMYFITYYDKKLDTQMLYYA